MRLLRNFTLHRQGADERALAAEEGFVLETEPGGVEVSTDRGTIMAKDAIIATNGYTPKVLGWFARRVIPFQAYMAATEELTEAQMDDAIPRRRTVLDSNTNIDFFRPAPDSSRLLFGGGTGVPRRSFTEIAYFLHRQRQLRMSSLGRWNGIFYFAPLVMVAIAALHLPLLSELARVLVRPCAVLLVLSTVASIIDRAVAPLRVNTGVR